MRAGLAAILAGAGSSHDCADEARPGSAGPRCRVPAFAFASAFAEKGCAGAANIAMDVRRSTEDLGCAVAHRALKLMDIHRSANGGAAIWVAGAVGGDSASAGHARDEDRPALFELLGPMGARALLSTSATASDHT